MPSLGAISRARHLSEGEGDRETARAYIAQLRIRTPSEAQKFGSCPARSTEDRHCEMACARLRDPVLRRADAGHRRRRTRSTTPSTPSRPRGAIVMIVEADPARPPHRRHASRADRELPGEGTTQEDIMRLATRRRATTTSANWPRTGTMTRPSRRPDAVGVFSQGAPRLSPVSSCS